MVEIGTIKRGIDIGYKTRSAYIWCVCPNCGKERWAQAIGDRPIKLRCQKCANAITGKKQRGENSPHWKGGKTITLGYIYVWVSPDDFFYPMATRKYPSSGKVAEHRLVMGKHLGRCLEKWEIVHHLNGIKDDNRIANLALVNAHNHSTKTLQKLFQKRIRDLEAQLFLCP